MLHFIHYNFSKSSRELIFKTLIKNTNYYTHCCRISIIPFAFSACFLSSHIDLFKLQSYNHAVIVRAPIRAAAVAAARRAAPE